MLSDTIASVQVFADKALELGKKGYLLRSVENYGRAPPR